MRLAITALAKKVGVALKARKLTLATAESCTGGGVAEAITRIAGSSEWFECGFVTYSNRAKQELLNVKPATLKKYGAVSEQVAAEMVIGCLRHSGADITLVVTGIAGPSGGTPTKPVGTVCFAWAEKKGKKILKTLYFQGSRKEIREQSVFCALQGILDLWDNSHSNIKENL